MISGVMLGWPTLRLRGDYLAIVTLGFGEIIRIVGAQPRPVSTNGPRASRPDPGPAGPHRRRTSTIFGLTRRQALVLAGAHARHPHGLPGPPAGAQPGRPGLAGDPRGRGRRRGDGRDRVQVQALGLRHRRGAGRPVAGFLFAQPAELHRPEPVRRSTSSILFVAMVVIGGSGNMVGVIARCGPAGLPARAVPRASADVPVPGLRSGAGADDDPASAGPDPEPTAGPRVEGPRGGARRRRQSDR